jgi:hypothetical protein
MNREVVTQKRGVILVSLGSSVMSAAYLAAVAREASVASVGLEVCLLAEPEITNVVALEGVPIAQACTQISIRCETLVSHLRCLVVGAFQISKWGDYNGAPRFKAYLEALGKEFVESHSFNRHCCNQVFRNLQPILRRHGIVSKRNARVSTLAQYLLEELALKLYLANERQIDVEFAPEKEMEVVNAIYDGKYPNLIRFATRRAQHFIVPPL